MAGRPRKPTQTKVLQGTFRSDRAPANEPEPDLVFALPKPMTLMPRQGKKLWKVLGEKLIDTGLLTEIDLPTFEICCFNFGLYRDLVEAVFCKVKDRTRKSGWRRRTLAEYLKGENSQTIPEYTALIKTFQTYKSYLVEFGLSPGARSRIDLPKVDDPDDEIAEMARMMNGR